MTEFPQAPAPPLSETAPKPEQTPTMQEFLDSLEGARPEDKQRVEEIRRKSNWRSLSDADGAEVDELQRRDENGFLKENLPQQVEEMLVESGDEMPMVYISPRSGSTRERRGSIPYANTESYLELYPHFEEAVRAGNLPVIAAGLIARESTLRVIAASMGDDIDRGTRDVIGKGIVRDQNMINALHEEKYRIATLQKVNKILQERLSIPRDWEYGNFKWGDLLGQRPLADEIRRITQESLPLKPAGIQAQ